MSSPDITNQPRVKHNDYSSLSVPKIGEWEPRLSVSVVIPAYGAQEKLDMTLAALAGQSYPSHLLEVVVVDDGSTPPLRLPEIVPERVRLMRAAGPGWGRANACKTGAELAEGDVIHWLDSDMVTFHDHVEAQMRWHHLADYLVVLGYKRFVDYADGELSQREVFDAVTGGAAEKLFDVAQSQRHEWVENIIDKTDGLRTHGSRSFGVHVGATASVRAEFLRAAGGMDATLVLGEDTDLGFRLGQQGAVFIPDPEARSWHLGASTVMRRREQVNRHNEAYLSHRLPTRRLWRRWRGRQWLVPYIDVVVDAEGRTYEEVRATVGASLGSIVPDVGVTVVGPWSDLRDGRRAPLDDPLLDLRLMHDTFVRDERIRLVERLSETSAPTPFRFICPPGWMPTVDGLRILVELSAPKDCGLLQLAVPEGPDVAVGRFERTEAVARALAVRGDGEKLDDVIDEMFGSLWVDGTESALVPVKDVSLPYLGDEGLKWKRRAESLEGEVARLKKKLQAPLSSKLKDAARRRVARGGQS
ncbi:MAG TPA: glycosyltransferase family 2 protein [Actinoallomurus sp.]|nr:glycosyltransferase family 2 protein [Actinoallomurus sp.]